VVAFFMPVADMTEPPQILVLAGPTGVGKTRFALELAHNIDAEILSIDSLQVYRHLNIGTAKASEADRQEVPHHLIDVIDPDETCNVARFMEFAEESIEDILGRGKRLIAAGGSNLYIRALIHGLFEAPPPDESIRARHKELANYYGVIWLYRELERVDPTLAARIHSNDLVRISRGLEVYEQTGHPLSALQDAHRFSEPRFRALKLVLTRPREDLYSTINRRALAMIDAGLLEEYQGILDMGYSPDLKPLLSVGYRHAGEHIRGNWDLETTIETLQKDTRRFAKQQLSWLRSEPDVQWVLAAELEDATIRRRAYDDIIAFFEGDDREFEWTHPTDPMKS